MKVLIQAKKAAADSRMKAYAQGKLEKLTRHFDQILEARMELTTEKNKSLETMKVARLVVHVNGTILKAVQSAEHVNEAVDLVVDKMDRQIRQHKERLRNRRKGKAEETETAVPSETRLNGVAKIKRFRLQPMSEEQAQTEMTELGHAFFVFLNEDSQEVNILYRRRNGSLGLVEAALG
jgi:ribosome hibernation promoting factor